jgi:hypothetical protein
MPRSKAYAWLVLIFLLASCSASSNKEYYRLKDEVDKRCSRIKAGMTEHQVKQILGIPFSEERGSFLPTVQTPTDSAAFPCSIEKAVRKSNYMAVLPSDINNAGIFSFGVYYDSESRVCCTEALVNSTTLNIIIKN